MTIPTKHCPQCGNSAASAGLFCAQCGSQFAPPIPESSSYVCEECNTVLPGGSRFCPGCGQAFDTPVPVTEPKQPSPGFRSQPPQPNPIPVTLHQTQPVPVSVQLKMPSFSHAKGPRVNYGWISESWVLFQQKPGVWILATLAQGLPFAVLYGVACFFGFLGAGGHVTIIPDSGPGAIEGMNLGLAFGMIVAFIPAFLLSCHVNCAAFRMANKQVRGESISFSDVFSSGNGMWPVFGLGFISNILIHTSVILFYVPGLIFIGLTLPSGALAAEGIGTSEAMRRSIYVMKNDWLNATVVVLLVLLIVLISAIPCGLGLLATYPMSILIVSLACRDMIGLPNASNEIPSADQIFASSPATEPSIISENQPSSLSMPSMLSETKATKRGVIVAGSVLTAVFLAVGFGLIRLAHPQLNAPGSETMTSAASSGSVPTNAATPASEIPADNSSASEPPTVQDNTARNDVPMVSSPPTLDTPDPAPEVSDNSNHATASTDDTMTAYAPAGSGLSDVPLSIDTLRNEFVTSNDLKRLSLRALSISHNSIYALHGYIFERPAIQSYFTTQDWYHPDPAFSASMLTSTEQKNVQTIRAAERANFGYGRHLFDEQGRSYEQRDPLRETASPDSGLDDTLLDLNTLQHTAITSQDLSDKSLAALSISYNAVYAAHGYVFKKASLQRLFNNASWYHPNLAFRETDLTSTERANLQTIRSYERSRFGY